MFKFTTQTVLNSVIQATDAQVKNGSATKGYNLIKGTNPNKPEVRIGNLRFNAADIEDIQEVPSTPEHLAKVTFDMNKLPKTSNKFDEGSYRIQIYVGLSMNSQDSYYSNAFVYKGKPLYIEFPVKESDTAAQVAQRIKTASDKYQLFTMQDKILKVTATNGNVTFEAVNGYQLIKEAKLQRFDPECCQNAGEFVDIIIGVPVMYQLNNNGEVVVGNKVFEDGAGRALADDEVAIEPGLEAFLDYDWLIHNLRLPTNANTAFWAVTKPEMPVVGGTYTQFILRMVKERDGIAGGIVGERATSVTTHVFYVLNQGSNVADFRTAIATLGTINKVANTALKTPYGSEAINTSTNPNS